MHHVKAIFKLLFFSSGNVGKYGWDKTELGKCPWVVKIIKISFVKI